MSRSTASLPHHRPSTPQHQQTHSLPTRNPTNLSPATRDRHLKQILDTHRADRQRIQTRHDEATGDLTDKLRRALSEVRRIEREFQNFQRGANAKLADILSENEQLRTRIAQLEAEAKSIVDPNKENRTPLGKLSVNVPLDQSRRGDRETSGIHHQGTRNTDKLKRDRTDDFPKREPMKPSERELEVERLREAARDSRRMRVPRRPSLRVLRKEDYAPKPRGDEPKMAEERPDRSEPEERRSIRLVRSLSRKWSACF